MNLPEIQLIVSKLIDLANAGHNLYVVHPVAARDGLLLATLAHMGYKDITHGKWHTIGKGSLKLVLPTEEVPKGPYDMRMVSFAEATKEEQPRMLAWRNSARSCH
jgi:hypothetical protein